MNSFIGPSLAHTVAVQNVFLRSRNTLTATFPSARAACREDRNAYHANIGKNRQDLSRSRVIDTNAISQS